MCKVINIDLIGNYILYFITSFPLIRFLVMWDKNIDFHTGLAHTGHTLSHKAGTHTGHTLSHRAGTHTGHTLSHRAGTHAGHTLSHRADTHTEHALSHRAGNVSKPYVISDIIMFCFVSCFRVRVSNFIFKGWGG